MEKESRAKEGEETFKNQVKKEISFTFYYIQVSGMFQRNEILKFEN
jgi:hypothetical protein